MTPVATDNRSTADGRRQRVRAVDHPADAGGPERLLGVGELVGETVAPVPGDGLSHLVEGTPSDRPAGLIALS